jgi:uncharacterized protein YjbJ (UPF0337 family)
MRRVEQKPPHLAGQVMSFQPKLRFRERTMDKDRVVGSATKIKGSLKEVVGKAVGDAKLEAEGKADKIEGKVQNAVGGLKDTVKKK